MRLNTLISSGLLLATSQAQIRILGYNTKECEGANNLDLTVPNVNQCNDLEARPAILSAEASNLQGCIVTLFSGSGCDADTGELFLDTNDACEDADEQFTCLSYDVTC